MNNTTLITSFIKTRLEQFNFPSEEIQWALVDVSFLADLDVVSMSDPIYPNVIRDRSYVAFYGSMQADTLEQWAKASGMFRNDEVDVISQSLQGGTILSLALYNGAPQVLCHLRAKASDYEKAVFNTFAKYINGKYNAVRTLLAYDIKLIHEAGLHNKPMSNDTMVKQSVSDIIYFLNKAKSQAA